MTGVKRIAVTGGAGQIAYSLLFRIATGEVFGPNQPIALHILEIPEAEQALEGVRMELMDCAFPLLKDIHTGTDPVRLFEGIELAFLVGSKPRGPGMERSDLLRENGKIFIEQGKALNESASDDAKVLVVGNPCNTNCWIALHHAPKLKKKNFFAMTRLDQNRATAQLADKAKVDITDVRHTAIWGNHSTTQVPDYQHATIKGKPVSEVINDANWLENGFTETVQKRGGAVIKARGKSSAASAANAAINTIQSLYQPTKKDDCFSLAVYSEGNPYGIDPDLVYSFPCRSSGDGNYEIISGIKVEPSLEKKLKASEEELIEERNQVKSAFSASEGLVRS